MSIYVAFKVIVRNVMFETSSHGLKFKLKKLFHWTYSESKTKKRSLSKACFSEGILFFYKLTDKFLRLSLFMSSLQTCIVFYKAVVNFICIVLLLINKSVRSR